MNYYITVLKKYAVFSGRASRAEYWYFFLVHILISILLGVVEALTESVGIIVNIYALALFLPSLAAGVRRMHDVGKSGWYILIPIYSLILLATKGEETTNEYGPVPDLVVIEEENPETY